MKEKLISFIKQSILVIFMLVQLLRKFRSTMNVTWRIKNEDLESLFINEASKQNLKTLKGHRSVGGIRASIYNAFPESGVDTLINFMKEFESNYG